MSLTSVHGFANLIPHDGTPSHDDTSHPMTTPPIANDLSVVIPTLGRECLRDSVRALAFGSLRPVEVILAHQGVPGALAPMLQEFASWGLAVQYLHSDQRGAAAGRNAGIARRHHPVLRDHRR